MLSDMASYVRRGTTEAGRNTDNSPAAASRRKIDRNLPNSQGTRRLPRRRRRRNRPNRTDDPVRNLREMGNGGASCSARSEIAIAKRNDGGRDDANEIAVCGESPLPLPGHHYLARRASNEGCPSSCARSSDIVRTDYAGPEAQAGPGSSSASKRRRSPSRTQKPRPGRPPRTHDITECSAVREQTEGR